MTYAIAETIGPFYVGDVPAPSVLTVVDEEGNEVDLSPVTSVTASLDGVPVSATVSADAITIAWPSSSVFLTAEIKNLELGLSLPTGTVSIQPARFVVDSAQGGWHTLSTARAAWQDAPGDVQLYELLEVARIQCEAYAPALTGQTHSGLYRRFDDAGEIIWDTYVPGESFEVGTDGSPVTINDVSGTAPLTYRMAQIMQARNVWNASRTDPASGGYGDGDFVVRPFPMDWTVKNLLRPKRAVPVVA